MADPWRKMTKNRGAGGSGAKTFPGGRNFLAKNNNLNPLQFAAVVYISLGDIHGTKAGVDCPDHAEQRSRGCKRMQQVRTVFIDILNKISGIF